MINFFKTSKLDQKPKTPVKNDENWRDSPDHLIKLGKAYCKVGLDLYAWDPGFYSCVDWNQVMKNCAAELGSKGLCVWNADIPAGEETYYEVEGGTLTTFLSPAGKTYQMVVGAELVKKTKQSSGWKQTRIIRPIGYDNTTMVRWVNFATAQAFEEIFMMWCYKNSRMVSECVEEKELDWTPPKWY